MKFFLHCKKSVVINLSFFMLGISPSGFALESVPANLLSGWNTISQATLKHDITFLASNKLQGRLALQTGDKLAISWIAAQFERAGLQPANGDSFLQAVDVIEYFPDTEQNALTLTYQNRSTTWKKPDIVTEFRQNTNVSGNLLFVGYGITAPDLHYDDYQNVDAHGKVVLMFEHEPQETDRTSRFNGTANTIYATNRIKALNAQQHGALAVLIMPEPNRKHPSNQERYQRISVVINRKTPLPAMVLKDDELQIPVVTLSDKVAKQIAGQRIAFSELQSAIDSDLQSHSKLIPDSTIKIHEQIKKSRLATTYNVVGLLAGSDEHLKNDTIIVSAHHDHDGMGDGKMWHGADDNASGTAGVVAMAHAMVTNTLSPAGLKPKRSVLFVVFAAEERGLLGSFYMAAHPLRDLSSTRAIINFDMIGRNEQSSNQTAGLINIPSDTTNRLNLIGSHYSPDYQQAVIQQNKYVGLTLDDRFDNETALNVFFRSDQFPFVLKRIPAIWWFTGFHPDYHYPSDTADKINYSKMQKILRLSYLTAYQFATDSNVPAFIKNPGK